ncbi:hypothetical protein RGU12_01950 [Fredinandcohnia sp. QZ13]|uniref:hypothetical protein n=1 Tax=Fredinandcohnia sp. QZ13 TaxID=3073144 RepID=UPI0028530BE9|nr:hypothetical protein [Fredinandcohnia sp. QZ13]MDR4886306.1 hypothetical protein [Fredinandcohnia sp. QZ13]
MNKKDHFKKALIEIFRNAKTRGDNYIEISSKDLHIIVGGYPGPKHNMPSCCDVMYEQMKEGDKILEAPKKGKGASLLIRYYL